MRSILLLLTGLLCTVQSIAQKPAPVSPKYVTQVENIKEYSLPNGMQVLLIPDATQSNVLVNITYKVGSRHEGYGETGMAHLLEHMLFKGTNNIRDIKKAIADKGASANGTTWYDRTNYYEILPASEANLQWALNMEADRMINSTIKKEDLATEFSVVRNEFESGENYPDGVLQERVLSSMYLWHNYGKSTIGSKEDIERVPVENLKAFYKKYYQPDNAVLIVAGKFDEDKTLKLIGDYFSIIPKPTRVLQPTYTVEPTQDGERSVTLARNGDIQYLVAGYHTPAFSDPDYASNFALIQMLDNEPSGFLYKALVETKLATKVSAYSQELFDPGFTTITVEIPKDKSLSEGKKAMKSVLDGLATRTITQEDLDRSRNMLIKSVENIYNNTIYFGINLTESIGAGSYKLWFLNRDRIENLKLEDVQRVAKKYYKSSNRTVGSFIPDKNPERVVVAERPDIDALVKDYKGKAVKENTESFDVSIANIKAKTIYGKLSNGMRYAILEKPTKGDKINATLMFKMGDEQSLSGKNQIAYLTSRMLKYGTNTRSRSQLSDELDKAKTTISFYGGTNTLYANINTDKENFGKAMDLLEDMLLHPAFDVKEYDKLILDTKADLENGLTEPGNVAGEHLEKQLNKYPSNHPLYPMSSQERLDQLNTVKLEDIKAFYNNFYGGGSGYASFVGGLDNKEVESKLKNSFDKWVAKTPYQEIEEKYFAVDGKKDIVQIDDKTNAFMYGGINVNLTQKDKDYVPLLMANEMLGGGAFLSSRIPQRLREAEGMSYGAGSFLSVPKKYPSGSEGFYAIFNPAYRAKLDAALSEEILKARDKGFTEEEWKNSLKSWMEQRKVRLGSNGTLAGMINNYMYNDEELDEYLLLENKAKSLNVTDINGALKKYVDPDKMILIYAGDFREKKE